MELEEVIEMFRPDKPILETIIRASAVYLGLFIILRVILKREAATLGMTDVLVIVLLASAAQNALTSDYSSVTDGFLLVLTIVGWSHLLNFLGHRFPFFERLIKSPKLLLVKDGVMNKRNMRKEFITEDELMSEIRISGVGDIAEVKEAYMEPTGRISVISKQLTSTSRLADRRNV